MKIRSCFVTLGCSILLCACQSVRVLVPTPAIDSPELEPTTGISYHFAVRPGGSIELSSNAGSRPPTLSKGDIDSVYLPEGAIGWMPSSNVILKGGLFGDAFPSGVFIKGQYQFYGHSPKESKVGDSSLSLIAQAHLQQQNVSGDQEYFGGPGHRDWKAKANSTGVSIGLSYGHRTAEKDLIFAGVGYGEFKTDGEIHQSATDTDPAADYDIPKRSGNVTAYAIGWDHQNSELSNFIGKLVYVNINHNDFNKGFAGIELAASFR